MEEKKIYRWFYGDKEHGRELIRCLVDKFGAKNRSNYRGDDESLIYFIDIYGEIQSVRKEGYDTENLKDRYIKYGENGIEYGDTEKAETIPAEAIRPTSTVVTAPFYMVCSTGFVMPDKYSSYEDAKVEAKRLAEKHKVKTYVLAPFAKFTLTAYEAPFDDSDKIN